MPIPEDNIIDTRAMGRIFQRTTAAYKFYWFIGLLHLSQHKAMFSAWEIVAEMVANAWYPVCYFHLSLGKIESLYDAILSIQKERNIPINTTTTELSKWLNENMSDPFVKSTLRVLLNNVPYRFLNPWIPTNDDDEMVRRSQEFENNCLYRIVWEEDEMFIELNSTWIEYLRENYTILLDFAYWNLAQYIQKRNVNVPNIPSKLVSPRSRESLARQHDYWDFVISHGGSIRCIYTGKLIKEGEYELDHFMPWSFVCHDLVWNLLPADSGINSSKSNKLPPLDKYLRQLAEAQQWAVNVALDGGFNGSVLDDYYSLGTTPQELADMSAENLYDCFGRTYAPMSQIAQNMGFEMWK